MTCLKGVSDKEPAAALQKPNSLPVLGKEGVVKSEGKPFFF
jgi:hypothetical protein